MPEAVTPMLGELELTSLQHITTGERRALVEHRVPGMAGSAFQDLGRSATCIELGGLLAGEEALAGLETLRGSFQAAESVPFTADITTATEIVDVLIEDLQVVEIAGRPQTFAYRLVLRESPPSPSTADPFAAVDAGILDDAQDLFDQAVALEDVLDTLGSVPDLADPTPPLQGILTDVESALAGLGDVASAIGDLFGES